MPTPAVSIILPAYNRRHVIGRAIDSVVAQSFQDWELIVVDDGSTDGTDEVMDRSDPRIRLIHQSNRGAAAARNHGIAEARGQFIAFLDSDDEWLPHFLKLTHEYLSRHPQDAFVATEFVELNSHGKRIQDRCIIRDTYAPLARRIGSTALNLPAGSADDYMRLYSSCETLGDWWNPSEHGAASDSGRPQCYRGLIGEAYRWGHLHALWCLLLRRETVHAIGPMAEDRRSCADYKFLVDLCRRFPAAMINIPSVVKHELDRAQQKQTAGHLSAGSGYAQFMRNQVALFEDLFVHQHPNDREIGALHALMCLKAAAVVLDYGSRRESLAYLAHARRFAPSRMWWTLYRTIMALSPGTRVAAYATRKVRDIEERHLTRMYAA
jgi:GT2 family glycosyltransferase